LNVKP